MPTPQPEPSAAELVTLADLLGVTTDAALLLISKHPDQEIVDAQWELTLVDIGRWNALSIKSGKVKRVGNIEFFEGAMGIDLVNLRNRVRLRYGLLPLTGRTSSPSFVSVQIVND